MQAQENAIPGFVRLALNTMSLSLFLISRKSFLSARLSQIPFLYRASSLIRVDRLVACLLSANVATLDLSVLAVYFQSQKC